MNTIPIAFSTDFRMAYPLVVCIQSLIDSALSTTKYQIYILVNIKDSGETLKQAITLINLNRRHTIELIDVGDSWKGAYEIREITIAAYYRLLLPSILLSHDKVLYADVDIIFQTDLSQLYLGSLEGDN
ncbi:MAG: glycosyltransferase, partial [Phocaeicola sp.]